MVHGLLTEHGPALRRLGGEMWGHYVGGTLDSVCWSGANLVPLAYTSEALDAFAQKAGQMARTCSSIVGPAHQVVPLWDRLQASWGAPRDARLNQPLMTITGPPAITDDPEVRFARRTDLEALVPASVAMFTEEVGYSPIDAGNYAAYVRRVADLVDAHRCLARIGVVDGTPCVLFKADVGALSPHMAQIQGVWVHPRLRGLGLAAPCMASVVRLVQARFGVSVSLYVNDFNTRAIRAYKRCGFHTVGTFSTVLF